MKIFRLENLTSTNDYLKTLVKTSSLEDFTVVLTNHQSNGKGQRGSKWISEAGKNLTFSVYKVHHQLPVQDHFMMNIVVSLAVFKVLSDLKTPNLKVKWPNDIMSGNKKIGGILIENSVQSSLLKHSIIGIGLNVNQTDFKELPNASSLNKLTGLTFDLDKLLQSILREIKNYYNYIETQQPDELKHQYLKHLYRVNEVSTFQSKEGTYFSGMIKNINDYGLLVVELEDDKVKTFDIKEIKLMN